MSVPVPPEIPEEFAAAYREAYERALAEQSPIARHVELASHEDVDDDTPDDERWAHQLPARAVPPAEGGAHAAREEALDRAKREARRRAEVEAAVAAAAEPEDDGGPSLFWLLVVIAVLCLVLGAYLLGLAFVD